MKTGPSTDFSALGNNHNNKPAKHTKNQKESYNIF